MKRNKDIAVGAFFVLFGLLVWLALVPLGVEEGAFGGLDEGGLVGPKLLPSVTSIAIAVVGTMLVIRALVTSRGDKQGGGGERPAGKSDATGKLSPVVRFVAVCGGYVLILYVFGYVVATVLLLVSLQWLFGERRRLALVLLPSLLSVGLYLFFRYALLVRFPAGRLFVLIG